MKALSVLVKPVSKNCNLNCKYCFYKDELDFFGEKHEKSMSFDLLEVLVKRIFESTEQYVRVVFQGGEPTLIGLDFYKRFVELVKIYNVKKIAVELSLQTNGILLDDEWCEFLSANKFLVGLSFDGCPAVNDENRIDYNSCGSSARVIRAIELLKKHRTDFNVLFVVTAFGAPRAAECYDFLKKIGVEYVQIIPVLASLDGKKKEFMPSGENFAVFLKELFKRWYKDFLRGEEVRVTYFENLVYKKAGNRLNNCSMNGLCSVECVVESDGNVYPCDFYVADRYLLGNLKEKSFPSMIFSEKASRFISESLIDREFCAFCKYFGYCVGACRRYRFLSGEAPTHEYCKGFKSFFDEFMPLIEKIADNYKRFNG